MLPCLSDFGELPQQGGLGTRICWVYWQRVFVGMQSERLAQRSTIVKPYITSYSFHLLVIDIDSGQPLKTPCTSLFLEFSGDIIYIDLSLL